jgi:hypothetical protein
MPPPRASRSVAGSDDQRRVVAGVRVDDAAGVGLDAGVAEGGERPLAMLRQSSRFTLAQTDDGSADLLRERAHRGLQVRHQQRRGQALAGDVGDREPSDAAERQRVEAIAADAVRPAARSPRESMPAPAGARRQQAALNQPRVLELALLR